MKCSKTYIAILIIWGMGALYASYLMFGWGVLAVLAMCIYYLLVCKDNGNCLAEKTKYFKNK
jgi:hypothetical protein